MTSKKYNIYNKIFSTIIEILENENIKYSFNECFIMCDFEYNLRKSIKDNFIECNLKGCYFHYIKNLWSKCKKIGLCKKKYIDKTKILIFSLKLITLIKSNRQNEFFNQIEKYAINGNDYEKEIYCKFIKYYKKVWLNSNYIRVDLCTEIDLEDRTNNTIEGFNNSFAKFIEIYKPRLSYFIEKIKAIQLKILN